MQDILPDCIFGWDVGGAHLKVVVLDGQGRLVKAIQRPCRLWLGLQEFDAALTVILCEFGIVRGLEPNLESRADARITTTYSRLPSARHAVTMTGELADCFRCRNEGVSSLAQIMADRLAPAQVTLFAGAHGFVTAAELADDSALATSIASANWLAASQFCAMSMSIGGEGGLLVDIGSTTTDIVAFAGGRVMARGHDDRTRLAGDELVYSGIIRTPLMAVASRVPFAGAWHSVVAEHFATTADVYRLTGELPEKVDQMPTADDAGKTVDDSARRLARMIGADMEAAPHAAWRELAGWFAECQLRRIHSACERILSGCHLSKNAPVIGAGTGSFIGRRLAARMTRAYVDFADLVPRAAMSSADADDWIGACAPAYSVARLALERTPAAGETPSR